MAKIIASDQIENWLQGLAKKKVVYVPQKNKAEVAFKKLGLKTKLDLDAKKTTLPVKEFFLPSREVTFSYDIKTEKLTVAKAPEPFIVFGLHHGDLEAMTHLDEVMTKPQEDYFYIQKRKKSTLIGLVNKTMAIAPGGDLILEKINDKQYRGTALTEKGQRLLKSKYFKDTKKPAIKTYAAKESKLKEMLMDSELLSEAVEWSWENDKKVWDDLSKICLGCGICTYVCPLCYCFSNEERVNLDGQSCSRCRHWDACTLPGFSKIAGGHNFHATLKERYYNWYYHKFVRAYKETGKSLCVACKRCKKFCPAKIDIEKVLSQILQDYLKSVKHD